MGLARHLHSKPKGPGVEEQDEVVGSAGEGPGVKEQDKVVSSAGGSKAPKLKGSGLLLPARYLSGLLFKVSTLPFLSVPTQQSFSFSCSHRSWSTIVVETNCYAALCLQIAHGGDGRVTQWETDAEELKAYFGFFHSYGTQPTSRPLQLLVD